MRVILLKFREVTTKYPIVRGMASYTVIWPAASLLQQKFISNQELNYMQALRFSLYGGFFVAPTLFCWIKFASYIWPKNDLKSGIVKALVEQVSYGPAAMCCFFFGINLLEFKPIAECVEEVKQKFWPTWKTGICVWPILQTINFTLIPERNRVVYVSVCSLMWTSFLAYMKSLEKRQLTNNTKLEIDPIETKQHDQQSQDKTKTGFISH
ncbi:mpv17-like protein [Diprion similis]|uniref:mpv17-like protein n=1 Tax=Diprion similis TaxID=362088 RepID=UPI001EF87BEF|nr:mpv17-like protein [Diprion similis]XP_046744496.1 mpv17-like protein [Diprion similis]